ncbi:MAG: tetratricopeptide repeat protein [Ignavibacteria bacterium]|nr:tetratricopeptide repeat protein [Ignavibacteria bacterium]
MSKRRSQNTNKKHNNNKSKANTPPNAKKQTASKTKKEINIESLKKRPLIAILIITLSVITAIALLITNLTKIAEFYNNTKDRIFSENFTKESSFKVLILPFQRFEKQGAFDQQIENALKDRFIKLKNDNLFDLEVIFDNNSNAPQDEAEARKIGNEKKSTFVIYGNFNEGKEGYEANIKYIYLTRDSMMHTLLLKDSVKVTIENNNKQGIEIDIRNETGYKKFESFSDISKGSIQNDFEELVIITMMLKVFYNKEYQRAFNLGEQLQNRFISKDYSLYKFQLECLEKLNDLEGQLTYYNRLIKLDSTEFSYYVNRGIVKGMMKNYEKAHSDFNKAKTLNDTVSTVYFNIGATYTQEEDYEKAIIEFKKALKLDSSDYNNYSSIAESYLQLGDIKNAKVAFNKYLEFETTNASVYANLGVLYKRKNMLDSAIYFLNKSISINSLNQIAFFNRGICYDEKNEHEKAVNDFTEAIKLDSSYYLAFVYRAESYDKLSLFEQAEQDFKKAIKIDSINYYSYSVLGYLLLKRGKYESAIDNLTKAINLNIKQPFPYNNRGLAFAYIGKFKEAFKDIEKSKQLNSKNPYLDKHLGITYDLKGDYKKSLKYLESASAKDTTLKRELLSKIDEVKLKLQ